MVSKFNAKLTVQYRIADLRFKVLTSLEIDIVASWVWSGRGSQHLEEHCFHL
jgi:hypothetical protein